MHLPFIAHTRARQMYVTVMCTRLKRVFRFISCRIVLISVQYDGDGCESIDTIYYTVVYSIYGESTSKDKLPQPSWSVFTKQYTFACYRARQSRVSTRWSPFTTHVKRIVISVYLNSVCYLISYTWLFTKLNLFELLLYVTFLTTKFSRSTVSCI